mmetsp:Transcript_5559/g.12116  ORF Transcript_5559/g.12116 Transcript_5559/m.12116 type:complete len:389 (-) Transcript_5559:3579-4745(-)
MATLSLSCRLGHQRLLQLVIRTLGCIAICGYCFLLNINLDDQIYDQVQHYGPLRKTPSYQSYDNNFINHKTTTTSNINGDKSKLLTHERNFPCIDKESPPAIEIQQILRKERHGLKIINPDNKANDKNYNYFKDMSLIYELTYAFVAAFQASNIPIFLAFGSHIGARRHHGIIPFGEKDVDFAIFSRDHVQVKDVIRKILVEKGIDTTLITEANFGYHVATTFSHYFDFWLFEHREEKEKSTAVVQCMGWNHNECKGCKHHNVSPGCSDWYRRYHGKKHAPIFSMDDWFPPKHEMFGTHRVPIPNASNDLTVHYHGGIWDKYCGNYKIGRPDSERLCSKRFGDYPFVFLQPESGTEELRQGAVVLHRSPIAAPIDSTPVYSKNKGLKM